MKRPWMLALLVAPALGGCRASLPAELDARPPRAAASAAEALPPPGIGDPAPSFELPDLGGRPWSLAALAGRPAVLLWFDAECSFLEHAYEHGGLAERAEALAARGVAWLAIDSSTLDRVEHTRARNVEFAAQHGLTHPILIDALGVVGKAYGARYAGEVVVVAADGVVLYRGSLDNAPFGIVRGSSQRADYVEAAVQSILRGEVPDPAVTRPYGCRVRYPEP